MNVLVTGGAGYIGSAVVSELLSHGHRVVVLDSLAKGHAEALPDGLPLVRGDLGSDADLTRAFDHGPFQVVVHLAAYIEAGESMREPARFFRNNTANTLRLAEAAVQRGVRCFIFSSTAAVYGTPQYTPMDESHPTDPTSAYGKAKLLSDEALDWISKLQGLTCVSLRYFNAAGADGPRGEDHRPETHLIPLLLETALGLRPSISLFGDDYPTPDGTCIRDYIHIRDLARAHVLAMDAGLSGRHVFNLGNGTGASNREVIQAVERITGRKLQVDLAPRRPGDPPVLVASSEKIRRELGWEPAFPQLDAIIRDAWEWKRNHPQGYGRLS